MDCTSRAPMDCLDVDVHLLSSSSFHTFLYFVVLEFIRLSLFSFSAAPFSSRLGATTVSLIIIPELLPFSSFSLARSVLHVPNANLMACFIVVSFRFVSFPSSIISLDSGFYGQCTYNVHFSPRQRVARPTAGAYIMAYR